MRKIVRVLGATVFSLLVYSVPIILTLSFAYNWGASYQFVCCVVAAGQFLALVVVVLCKTEEGE